MRISDLREVPAFADTVADRGWHAWWTGSGVTLADYRAHLDPMVARGGLPFALVAHDGAAYLGSVLLIENDLDARPGYAPWIAALWVDPAQRRQGVAAALIAAARAGAARLGHATCFLCATPDLAPFYLARGFRRIEEDVGGLDIFAIGGPAAPPGA
jgi:GNAT superfamily N-acetyltransferase